MDNQLRNDLKLLRIDESQKLTERYVRLKYKQMAKETHPDKQGGTKINFQELLDAYRRVVKYVESIEDSVNEDEETSDKHEKEFFMKNI